MNRKSLLVALLIGVLALGLLGAREGETKPLKTGASYVISNGAAAVKGQVLFEIGAGWYRVKRSDSGKEISVNVANAFFIEETK